METTLTEQAKTVKELKDFTYTLTSEDNEFYRGAEVLYYDTEFTYQADADEFNDDISLQDLFAENTVISRLREITIISKTLTENEIQKVKKDEWIKATQDGELTEVLLLDEVLLSI